MRKALKVAAVVFVAVVALVGAGLVVFGLPLADIRPASVALTLDPVAEARGKELLAAAYQAHGGPEAFESHQSARFTFTDTWVGIGTVFNPWPDDNQRLEMTTRVHSFDSTVHFLNGPQQGQTWGITDGVTWRETDGMPLATPNPDLQFMLPTVHYFTELPQRLTEAPLVQYVGREVVRGEAYEVVYATWESLAANPTYDQYMIYIDPDTGRLAKVHYTVREIMPLATGVCHLDDQRNIDGYWVPHKMSVTDAVDTDPDAFMHRMVIADYAFDKK